MYMIDAVRQDLRYAARTFRRAPGFVALAILTIAIGVGANATIFSVVNATLLRPLPFTNPERLVLVAQRNRTTKVSLGDASPANFLDWRIRNHSFTGMTALRDAAFTLASGDRPERIGGAIVNANFFDVLGVTPSIGRSLQPEDERPGAPRVAILSDALWRARFGGRTDVIGVSVRLNDEPHTIVGVLPPGIDYPDQAKVWVPPHWAAPDDPLAATQDPTPQRGHGYLFVLARLKPGVTRQQGQADMDAVAATLERDYPDDDHNIGVAITSLRDDLVGDIRPTLLMLFASVGLLLVIATANVSGLLIARATARHQEMSVRLALGATRGRIIGQLLTESVLLASVGGACGVLFAMWLVGPLVAISPSQLRDVRVDTNVLVFGLAISTAAGLFFGVAPARQSLQANVHDALKQSVRGGSGSGQRRIRAALVIGEIALSLVLLVAAGLTIRSFIRLQHVPTGFDSDHVLTLSIALPTSRYPTPRLKADFWERGIALLGGVPGVDVVGATSRLPLSGGNSTRGLMIDGQEPSPASSPDYRTASPAYFRALGIRLVRGRVFVEDDRENRPLVAVISESMARRCWPNLDPLGHHLSINDNEPITIVGIVADVHHASLEATPRPTFYVPYRQDPWPSMTFVLRTAAAPAALRAPVRDAIWRVDKDQPVGAMLTMDERLSNSLARRRFSVTLLLAFGVVAVTLAAVGLYGVLAFIVAQRRREIGVRMALGASARDVVADVMGHGLRLAGIGVLVGLALALAATRLITTLLYGTSPTDVATFASVATLLIVIAAGASALPALRASRVSPLVALRDE
jgi:putative ABC transport system permease protein